MPSESNDGYIGGKWYEWVMEGYLMTYGVGHPLGSASQGDPKLPLAGC